MWLGGLCMDHLLGLWHLSSTRSATEMPESFFWTWFFEFSCGFRVFTLWADKRTSSGWLLVLILCVSIYSQAHFLLQRLGVLGEMHSGWLPSNSFLKCLSTSLVLSVHCKMMKWLVNTDTLFSKVCGFVNSLEIWAALQERLKSLIHRASKISAIGTVQGSVAPYQCATHSSAEGFSWPMQASMFALLPIAMLFFMMYMCSKWTSYFSTRNPLVAVNVTVSGCFQYYCVGRNKSGR